MPLKVSEGHLGSSLVPFERIRRCLGASFHVFSIWELASPDQPDLADLADLADLRAHPADLADLADLRAVTGENEDF